MSDLSGRVSAPPGHLHVSSSGLGAVFSGRVRVQSQRSDDTVLVPFSRAGSSGVRCSPSVLAVGPPVLGPSIRTAGTGDTRDSGAGRFGLHSHSPGMADSSLVVSSSDDVRGLPGPRSLRSRVSAPDEAESAALAQSARAWFSGGGISRVRQVLESEGFDPPAIQRIVRRFEKGSGDSLSRHRRRWDTVYVPWCEERGYDPYRYNIPQVVNFLEREQNRFERVQDAQQRAHNHSGFKESRAAVSAFLQLIYPHLQRVSDNHYVKSMASELRKSAPNLPKYVETIPLDPLFLQLVREYKAGRRFDTMPLIDLRDRAMTLSRLKVHGRSADIAVINRGFTSMKDPNAGLVGSPQDFVVTKVRYDFNKTWKASGNRFSDWKDLGPYLHERPGFRPEFALCCARSAIETYLRRTYDANIAPWVDQNRPQEHVFRLFLTSRGVGPLKLVSGLKPDTVSNRIKGFMFTP